MAQSYENLDIWKESLDLTVLVYQVTRTFPKDELYGIVSQMRRAAVSIPSNIAEGSGRSSKKEFAYFTAIAIGSLNELESLIQVSRKLQYISESDFIKIDSKIKQTGKMLGGFKKYLSR